MQKFIMTALLIFIPLNSAMGETASEIENNAQKSFQQELTRCAVFYETMAGCLSDSDENKQEFKDLFDVTINEAIQVGLKVKMTSKEIQEKLLKERTSLISDMDGKCVNYQVIVNNHYVNCVNVTKQGQKRIMYWRHKAQVEAAKKTQ